MNRSFADLLCVVGLCGVLHGCVEAKFTLAPDSRLPIWFSSATSEKDSVKVTLTYLTPSQDADDAVLELLDSRGRSISTVRGQACWHPIMLEKKNGFDYPYYRYVKANGAIEVIEHRRMEPIFWISADPDLKRAAAEAQRCEKGSNLPR